MRILFLLTLLLSSLNTLLLAQTTNEALAMELEEFILSEMSQNNIPGLSASIVKDGVVVWSDSYGIANFSTNTLVTENTQFTLASISKLFTVLACVQLWETGELDIDADINDYLSFDIINPNFPNTPITVRQLMLHQSSLKDNESDLQLWDELGDPIFTLKEFCENYFVQGGNLYQASNWKTASEPGNTSYWYSNAGFTLLGYVVEEVSNQPFNLYCKDHIFSILQMPKSGWNYTEVDTLELAMPYNNDLVPYGYYSVPEYPAAMMKSDIMELSNFLIAITKKGSFNSHPILQTSTFETMLPQNMQNGFGWWGKDTWYGDQSGNFWSHGGFMNGVRTQLNYYPSDDTGLIILTNGQGNYQDIQNKMESLIPQFEITTSISATEKDLSISIFPNPSKELLYLNLEISNHDVYRFVITDIFGKEIYEDRLLENTTIDVSILKSGIYTFGFWKNDVFS